MKKLFFIALLLILIVSCAKEIVTRKYYMLDFSVDSLKTEMTTPKTTDALEILPVDVTEVYAQHRIAVRKRSHEINYYQYHQWGESPDLSVARLIKTRLHVANLFSQVSERIWNTSPRYQLHTYVDRIEAVEGDDSLFAHVKINLELFDQVKKKFIVEHDFDRSIGYEDWDINLIAEGMSRILASELGIFTDKIRQYLDENQTSNQ